MYQLILIIQFISSVIVFFECWIVFRSWRGSVHSYLFLSCAATLVNNVGYYMELLATSEEAYFNALRVSYLGRVWISFALFMFICELGGFHVHNLLRDFLALLNMATYLIVFTTKTTGLYYYNISFTMSGNFPNFIHSDGIWHHLWNGVQIFYILFGLTALFIARHKESNIIYRKRLEMVIYAILTEATFLVLQMAKPIQQIKHYDVTMLSFPTGAVFILIAIFKYRLLSTENLAKEYLIEELSEAIIAVDSSDCISYYNKPAANLFPEITEKKRRMRWRRKGGNTGNDSDDIIATLRTAINTEKAIKKNGRIYTPEANTLYQNGVMSGTIYSLTDDTEKYEHMAMLEEQKALADAANKAKSAFLANMSHEIRTPINAVMGMDEMILREAKDPEIVSYAADIHSAGHTLLSIINDILDFSKIEEGKMEILPTQYELASVIADLVNMIRGRAEKKGLKLEVAADESIPHLLYGDEIRIKQILINLLTNAVKYTETGSVKLSVSYRKITDDEIGLIFGVTDTGIGMKPEDMDKLFSPFSRIEEERNRSIEGTGLGMSIVKQLLALMDSELKVQSEYGKGSEFSFEILQKVINNEPMGNIAERYDRTVGEQTVYHELFHAPDANILVVDDTEVNLTVIRNLLKRTRIGIDTAVSGKTAIPMARSKDYDIIFIDHMMPEMDGIETMHRMREENTKDVVYVVLTANAVSGAREEYLREGFNDYLSKPVDGKELEELIKKYLPENKLLPPTDGPADAKEASLPEWLQNIPEIDTDTGIANCGSVESFLSVVDVFHKTAADKAAEIENLYNEKDIENYTIKVHALKSSARIIGASDLSIMAKALESAGKHGEMDVISRDTYALLIKYRELDSKLASGDEKTGDLPALTEKMRKEAFITVREIAESMDYGMMEDMIKNLRGYDLTPEDTAMVKEIEDHMFQLDWDGIIDMVKDISI